MAAQAMKQAVPEHEYERHWQQQQEQGREICEVRYVVDCTGTCASVSSSVQGGRPGLPREGGRPPVSRPAIEQLWPTALLCSTAAQMGTGVDAGCNGRAAALCSFPQRRPSQAGRAQPVSLLSEETTSPLLVHLCPAICLPGETPVQGGLFFASRNLRPFVQMSRSSPQVATRVRSTSAEYLAVYFARCLTPSPARWLPGCGLVLVLCPLSRR